MKSIRLVASTIESHSRMSITEDIDSGPVRLIVAGRPDCGKSIMTSAIHDLLIKLGIAEDNIVVDSADLDMAKFTHVDLLKEEHILTKLREQKYVIHETHMSRPFSLTKDDFERFKDLVDTMSTEWLEKGGDVTCEFSTSEYRLDEKHRYLYEKRKDGVYWKLEYCDVCVKHHNGLSNYHVEITAKHSEEN